jgi:hypothetical protein
MGASDVTHRFSHHDWEIGVRDLKVKSLEKYGHQDGYSGKLHNIDHIRLHNPNVKFKNDVELWDYIERRLERINKGCGEVLSAGVVGYSIAKPVITDYHGPHLWDSSVTRGVKEPAILLHLDFTRYNYRTIAKGTVAELKEKARKLLLREKFENDYVIIGKNISQPLLVTGEGKMVGSTTMTSDANKLVLPYHDWIVYGSSPN